MSVDLNGYANWNVNLQLQYSRSQFHSGLERPRHEFA
jgi:hypothetical protein